MQEQELFQGYEVKNWDFSPRLYKILIFSAIFNVLALLVVAQSNLLTTKGCDSPLVGGVCQVLDTLYVGGSALAADKEYVNEPYAKTELPSADEIVWIPVSDDPFTYPEGYFAQSDPASAMGPMEIPGDGTFPSYIPGGGTNPTTGGGTELINTAPVLPKDNPTVVTDKPDLPYSFDTNPTNPKPGKTTRIRTPKPQRNQPNPTLNNDSPTNLPDLNGGKTATTDGKTKPSPNDKVSEIVINKKPMQDFAAVVRTKYDKKEVDLTQNFKVVAEGFLTKDGKLDVTLDKNKQPRSRVTIKEGNPEMIAIAEQAIAAIGDSGWLGYLRNQGVEKINFTVVQNNDNLQVVITSDQPTPERAKTMASGLNGVIQGALLLDKNGVKKLGDDERVLLSSAKVTDSGKQFILDFVLAKPIAQEMITRKLKEPVDINSTQEKTNGNSAQVGNTNQQTAK
jgi:hypothetical protein